ncbi:MAG: alpha/beta fold hydrolase [Saprospiraceae bacterium]
METKEQLHPIKTEGDEFIALWQISSQESKSSKNIFLNHGTFSDRKICLSISQYFARKGYHCWIMEWRNHGHSSPSSKKMNFENIGTDDYPIVFKYMFNILKIKEIDCICHSGAGICLSIFLVENPKYFSKINRIAMFGSQAFGANHNFKNHLKLLFGKYVNALLGYSPAKMFGRPHDEDYFFMKQWYDWNLTKKFIGMNGVDYEKEFQKINIPILSICAKGDDFIASREGCEKFLNAFQNPNNKLLFCSIEDGFQEDYNHSRVLQSRNSSKEIWPKVADWLEGKTI